MNWKNSCALLILLAAVASANQLVSGNLADPAAREAVSGRASYDPARLLYEEYDAAFLRHWQERTGERVAIRGRTDSPDGIAHASIESGWARSVPLASAFDLDALPADPLLPPKWERRIEQQSPPFHSTVVFLVRRDNPKAIHDWSDLVRADVRVATSDPKSSGAGRWAYLAAWGYALRQGKDDSGAREFVRRMYEKAEPLFPDSNEALLSFAFENSADVLIALESHAHLIAREHEARGLQVVTPKTSVLVEPSVAVIDRVVLNPHLRKLSETYLEYLYSPGAQDILGRHFLRPRDPAATARHPTRLPTLELFSVEESMGGWRDIERRHFRDGGEFDRLVQAVP